MMGEIEAVECGAHLHRNWLSIQAARPDTISRAPVGNQEMTLTVTALHKAHLDRRARGIGLPCGRLGPLCPFPRSDIGAGDLELYLIAAQPHRPATFARHRAARLLSGYAALSLP